MAILSTQHIFNVGSTGTKLQVLYTVLEVDGMEKMK